MKNLLTQTILIVSTLSTIISAQPETSMNCVSGENPETYNGQIGGYALPSEGTIRIFFVFVQFPDDNFNVNDPYWIKGQAPVNMYDWANETWGSIPIQGSMTHYFNEISFNKLKIIGSTASAITPHTRQWYLDNNKKRGDIHKEVLQQLDQTWDFAQFDNWDLVTTYNHSNQPDGIVEMIIMIWRNIAKEYPDSLQSDIYQALDMQHDIASLGGSQFTVDNGARTIKTGFWPNGSSPGGSGVTVRDHLLYKNIRTALHEFAHYLMGGNEYHVGYGFWGMLEAWGKKNQIANSFERFRLGWINTIGIDNSPDQTIQNATLPDYVTTGISYRLNINPSTNEFFFIENHQKLSYWEQNTTSGYWANNMVTGNVENGLYTLRQDGFVGSSVQIVPV